MIQSQDHIWMGSHRLAQRGQMLGHGGRADPEAEPSRDVPCGRILQRPSPADGVEPHTANPGHRQCVKLSRIVHNGHRAERVGIGRSSIYDIGIVRAVAPEGLDQYRPVHIGICHLGQQPLGGDRCLVHPLHPRIVGHL